MDGYDDPIVLSRKGITVGGVKVPGCISRGVTVSPCPDGRSNHWTVSITLMTGTPPVFESDPNEPIPDWLAEIAQSLQSSD